MDVVETIGGAPVLDPFRWLEDDADPAVVAWQKDEDEATVRALAASPHAAAVSKAVKAAFVDMFGCNAPERHGDTWFRRVVPEGRSKLVLRVSSAPMDEGRVLVDPLDDGPDATLAICVPSPDGARLLVGVDVDGAYRYRVLDVASGEVIHAFPAIVQPCSCAWAPEGHGFYFQIWDVKTGADGQLQAKLQIWFQPLSGEAESQDLELDHPFAWPWLSADGRWIGVMCDQTSPRLRWARRSGSAAWIRFLPDSAAMYKGAFVGDDYFAITDDTSGWGRLVAIPVETSADRSTWRELLPVEEETKLTSITRCGDYLALSTIEGGVMRLKALDLTGRLLGEIPLPGEGAFSLFGLGHINANFMDILRPDGDGCTFVRSSLDRSPAVYRADLAGRSIEELEPPARQTSARVVERISAEGPQGPVRAWLVRKPSTPLDGSAPVIVTGYGGYNVPWIPVYSVMGAAWTELGGVWAHTQLRGGGERDTEFWRAGRMHRKQGTFDDLYAVIEHLHAHGLARPERTGVWGSSNGGLLVGAAVSQRPDLMRAGVAQVPLLDMVRFRKDPLTANIAKADYGDADNPADAAVMFAYSPYHHVRPGVTYPALFCDAGAHDTTCPPWHSRKMTAAIRAASSAHRALFRAREGAGHNQMTYEHHIEREIEELTFFCDELMGR